MLEYIQGGDEVKPNKPKFWLLLSGIYLVFLCVFICVFNPDFTDIKNCFLLAPLYIPLFISSYLKHKNDEYARDGIWETKYSFIFSTALIGVIKITVDYFR